MTTPTQVPYVAYSRISLNSANLATYVVPFLLNNANEVRVRIFNADFLETTNLFTSEVTTQQSVPGLDYFDINTITIGLISTFTRESFARGTYNLWIDRITPPNNELLFLEGADLAANSTFAIDKLTRKVQELQYQTEAAVKVFNSDSSPKDEPLTNVPPNTVFAVNANCLLYTSPSPRD